MSILEHRDTVAQQADQALHSSPLPISATQARDDDLSAQAARQRIERQLLENASRPLTTHARPPSPESLPHVYSSSSAVKGNVLSQFGSRFTLPMGSTRVQEEFYEEVVLPPAKPVPPKSTERLITVSELDPLVKGSFPGKTNVAMLSILRVLDQHRLKTDPNASIHSTIQRKKFKIIYVAPMKALASEIVRNLSRRLKWLSIEVRELTGDMQMTKAEIAETQIIVTTPEKWDVVTRKPSGEGEVASNLKLLIIDEVHLLNEDRGAVIETIVARTLRQVESSQSVIRIVGLSATLPNYIDVATFLSVSLQKGLFYFDSSFRPIPLEQHFLGIKGKPGSPQHKKNLDRVTYDKVCELVAQGHQVMVFVHARKETVKAALNLRETAMLETTLDDFNCESHPQWSMFRREIGESRNKEMKQLFDSGFGIHHAGMLRSDRNMMERMFEARAIKVLCCTATLAWGVNLPAHAVIIKGTNVYDSAKGKFDDLSVLDVLQVFGRAGRPGLESSGEGYLCTSQDKLDHYLERVTSQIPIESTFQGGLIDALNAEISLGTVASVRDASQWLRYTYLFVRMKKNPMFYGMTWDSLGDDPSLDSKRIELISLAARKLADANMITIDRHTESYAVTELGRIAAKYYIRYASVEIFNKIFKPKMTEADVLNMLSKSTEFEQVQLRESEIKELESMLEVIPCDVEGIRDSKGELCIASSQAKVNILLQAFISNHFVEDFALVSDSAYCAQNGGRIIRALLEIGLSHKWASVSGSLMRMSKAIEKRMWPFEHPLRQFELKQETLHNVERWADEWPVHQLADLSAEELGKLIHLNERNGLAVLNAAKQFPSVKITCDLRPLAHDVLQITVHVERNFTWNSKVHGSIEPFWLWVENQDGTTILQVFHLAFKASLSHLKVEFLIPIPGGIPPPSVTIRFVSDRWMSAEEELQVSLASVDMPTPFNSHTMPLDLPFLPLNVLQNSQLETLLHSRIRTFNAIQSQTFWPLFSTRSHTLVCAPVGSGKTTMAQLLILSTAMKLSDATIILVVPRRDTASEVVSDLQTFASPAGVIVDASDGPNILKPTKGRVIRIVTAANLFRRMAMMDPRKQITHVNLVVCEQLENIDSHYELGVSLLRHATQSSPTRYVGFSSSLSDPTDLGTWLGVASSGLHSFTPTDREHSLTVSVQTFTIPQSAALFKAMAKPTYTAVKVENEDDRAIVFIPSRSLCTPIARDIITQCILHSEKPNAYLPEISEYILEDHLARLQDRSLVEFVGKGVGFFYEGMKKSDRMLILRLFAEGVLRVLLVPRDSSWSLPIRASTVVVMGTQYLQISGSGETETRQLRDYSLTELVHMQSRAVQYTGRGRFYLFCQAESKDSLLRFLNKGLPLESDLLDSGSLQAWYNDSKTSGAIDSKQSAMDALSFTYLSLRMVSNPVYYDCEAKSRNLDLSRLVDSLEEEYLASKPATE
ncbi:hypothetical protein ONZ45_g38 [Pleurotus djamor]|nr:hypothetical protein ONZ45_g38 [Pleurotus djamor]